jgi:CRP/FNR family transcriptional regulator
VGRGSVNHESAPGAARRDAIAEVDMPDSKRGAVDFGYGSYHRGVPDRTVPVGTGGMESATFLHGAKRTCFAPREVIYREGETVDTVYAINRGLVKLLSYLPNGRGRIVRLYGKGIWIGLEGLLRRPYEHTAIAIDEVEACRLPANMLRLVQRDDPRDYQHIMHKWHEHLVEADMWISDFSTGAVRSRVARLIGFLSRIEERHDAGKVKLLTCDEMSAILGVTPESVSRIIAEFKRGGVLRAMDGAAPDLYQCDAVELERVSLQ